MLNSRAERGELPADPRRRTFRYRRPHFRHHFAISGVIMVYFSRQLAGSPAMVMPNQHDGASSPGWWDDLPPQVKQRVSPPVPTSAIEPPPARREEFPEHDPAPYRPAVISDLSRLAILFLVVALANVLFLLVALPFLAGGVPIEN